MDLIRLFAIIKKEIRHILRDPRSLVSAIILPIGLMLIYCESLSLDVKYLPICVMNYDNSAQSRDLLERFTSSGYFSINKNVSNYRDLQESVDSGECVLGLIIPSDFGKNLKSLHKTARIQALFDGSDPNRGSIGSSYSSMLVQTVSQEYLKKRLNAAGLNSGNIPAAPYLRVWFNPTLESKFFIIPGLIVLIMAILAALLTSTAISKEWENGTMELLISTPVTGPEIVFGKLIPYFVIGLIDTVLLIIMGYFIYHVPIKGSILLLSFIILLFLFGVLMTGMLISIVMKSSLIANMTSLVLMFLPTMLLSGFVFFIPAMPKFLRFISSLMPATYFTRCSHGIYLRGSSMQDLAFDIFMIIIFDIIVGIAAFFAFRKRLD